MSRGTVWLGLLTAAGILMAGNGANAQRADRPNIVVIMADDFGYECVGVNGGDYRTPNLDRLAAEGVRFERAYAQPLCTPSRLQLMTGQYNIRNYTRFGALDARQQTFGHWFRAAGYRTGIFGKWQLGREKDLPQRFGFDEAVLWQHTRRPARYANPGLEFNGVERDYRNGEFGEDLLADAVCLFLEQNKARPFVAYYPMVLTHGPFEPPPNSPDYRRQATGPEGDPSRRAGPRYFPDMVAHADAAVGKVLRKLDELGLRDRTLVLFTGDNGTGRPITTRFRGQALQGGKGLQQEIGMHVPLMVRLPGRIPAGRVTRDLVDFTDFVPTLLDCTGIGRPKGWTLDGHSLWPRLTGKGGAPRRWIYSWYARDGGPTGSEFARGEHLKLYRDGRLFDVEADPGEKQPLSSEGLSDAQRREYEQLHSALKKFANARPEWTWKNVPPVQPNPD